MNTSKKYKGKNGGSVRVSSFTLVELITVIIIMAFIMAIGIPAFTGMFKGQAVGNSTATASQLIKLCRSYAISHHQYIALIIPQPKYPTTGIPSKYYNTSLRPAIVTRDDDEFIFQKWVDGESWTLLQPGTAILELDNDDTDFKRNPNIDYITTVKDVDFSDIDGDSNVKNVSAIIFKYNGIPYTEKSDNFFLEIGRGAMTPAGLKVMSDGKPMRIEVSTATGMVFVDK